jgi:hypothetical protein
MSRASQSLNLVVSISGLLLFGCGSATRVVVLQHTQTKQTVECKVDPWGSMNRRNRLRTA